MNKKLFQTSCFLLAAGIILGAFAAHGLKETYKLSNEKLAVFETGVKYHLIHALALLVLSLTAMHFNPKRLKVAAVLILVGILFFSGSVYLLATIDINGLASMKKVLGPVTPLGGSCFIAGWILLAFSLKEES